MNDFNRELGLASDTELERVIEPLASYICATSRPRAALLSALQVLFSEVRQTNRAANALVASFTENHWS